MQDIALATSEADATAAAAVEQHHAEMAGTLAALVESVVLAAAAADGEAARRATTALLTWSTDELVPHALAEEKSLYQPAQAKAEGRLLVDGMLDEHKRIVALVHELGSAADPVRAAATATALRTMFDSHLAKENELVLPLLLADPEISVSELLGGLHELLGGEAAHAHGEEQSGGCGGHSCGCGEVDGPGFPELDARQVPHAIRHATIFGALDAVQPGGGLVLVAPHDPLPLLRQIEDRTPGRFRVEYLERGPEAWRLAFAR